MRINLQLTNKRLNRKDFTIQPHFEDEKIFTLAEI